MAKRLAGEVSSLVKRSTFSSAISVTPTEIGTVINDRTRQQNDTTTTTSSSQQPRPYSEIPGPKELPFIGNSWRFAPIIGQYHIYELDKVTKTLYNKYGKLAKISGLMGHPDLLFVFDGDEIQKVFRKEEVLPHRPSMPSLHHYKSQLRKDFYGDTMGLIGVHGEKWDKFRAQVQTVMLQPSTARKYITPLNEIADDFMSRINDIRDHNHELPGDFLHELYKWALESIGRVALDKRLGCVTDRTGARDSDAQKMIDSINTFFWSVAEVELRLPIWRFYKTKSYKNYIGALDTFRDLCMKHINMAMEKMANEPITNRSEENISIVERILQKTGNPKIAAVLAVDLFLVGVDTTSVAATSTIYQLSQNPEKQKILFKEIKSVLPKKNSPIDVEKLDKLPYLKACIRETLRMYPVVIGNGRSLQTDAVIGGYNVPKGTHVIFPHLVVSNLEEYFSDPEQFIPERWLKHSEVTDLSKCPHSGQKIHPFVSLPFGHGRRICIGKRFAEAELLILLSKLFRNYHVEYNYGKLTYKVNPTYIPEQPLKFKLIKREE